MLEYIKFETAKTVYKKGIDVDYYCNIAYSENGKNSIKVMSSFYNPDDYPIQDCPQCVLQRILREEKDINIEIRYEGIETGSMEYCYIVKYLPEEFKKAKRWVQHVVDIESGQFYVNNTYNGFWKTYEEALEEALVKALNLI
jgi:hypothetical protein